MINLNTFSIYRTELMGIATILIIVCHMPVFGVVMPHWLQTLLGCCGFGVDMFLFLSGMGMYNSYVNSQMRNKSVFRWLLKRYLRIVVPLGLIVGIVSICPPHNAHLTLGSLFFEAFGFGAFFGHSPLWFVTCILTLYLLTPILHPLLVSKYKWGWLVGMSLCCYVYAYLPPSDTVFHFMLSRWPIYFLGYVLSDAINHKKKLSVGLLVGLPLVLYVALYVINHKYGFHFCVFGLQGIAMLTIFTLMLEKCSSERFHTAFRFMGKLSLESYITNEYVIRTLMTFSWTFFTVNINDGNWTCYMVGTVCCILLSFVVNKVTNRITLKLNRFL